MDNIQLHSLIRNGAIQFAGNSVLKIYGSLRCGTGKRMLKNNRVFFATGAEALQLGYRPCGHCKKDAYRIWKLTSHV